MFHFKGLFASQEKVSYFHQKFIISVSALMASGFHLTCLKYQTKIGFQTIFDGTHHTCSPTSFKLHFNGQRGDCENNLEIILSLPPTGGLWVFNQFLQ